VVPPQLALGPALALDAEKALLSILGRCMDQPACRERFGDPAAAYRALRESLQAHPVSVTLPDPTTGEPSTIEFTTLHLATVLRLASYTAEQAALLPLALHLASRSGDFVPLAAQFLVVHRSYGDLLAYGMHNTVVCSEDVPFYSLQEIDREALERTYRGDGAARCPARHVRRVAARPGGRRLPRAPRSEHTGAAAFWNGRPGHASGLRRAGQGRAASQLAHRDAGLRARAARGFPAWTA
jgi:hypothetical protein